MMEHKSHLLLFLAIIHLFLFLLTLPCVVVPVDAIPVTRILALEDQGSTHLSLEDKVLDLPSLSTCDNCVMHVDPLRVKMMEDELIHGRMDFERNDYSGWGANNRHDPRLPGGRD